MFSLNEKRIIAEQVQRILKATNHPELPQGEIAFELHVEGAEEWSWADIKNNGAIEVKRDPTDWNERFVHEDK
jgi:hypothetical protein